MTRKKNDKNAVRLIRNSTAEFLIFTGQAGEQSIEARYEDETVWLSQKLMAELFAVSVPTINEHLKNIYETGELSREATIRNFRIVQSEGGRDVARQVDFYNLDAIISVGYRVNSVRATQFRQWATQVLRDFALKGYLLDKKRLENGSFLGEEYFEQLLEEIREIRLSERKFYQKITDIYATSIDYNKDAPTTRAFFATQSDTTAVFCMSDTVAMGVIRALTDMGRRVPEDVGVIGFDGIEMSKFFVPRITTIEQPIDEIARESVRVLMDMLENGRPPRHIVVPAKVQMRESV